MGSVQELQQENGRLEAVLSKKQEMINEKERQMSVNIEEIS
jgi:hypothetical protein